MIGKKFDEAIEAHSTWIIRFEKDLMRSDRETFDPERVRNDTICDFWHWMHDNKILFQDQTIYKELEYLHKSFHEEAARVSSDIDRLRRRHIDIILLRFDELSQKLIDTLRDARDDASKRKPSKRSDTRFSDMAPLGSSQPAVGLALPSLKVHTEYSVSRFGFFQSGRRTHFRR